MFDAHAVHVQWPWAYVADGPGRADLIVDVRAPIAPRIVGGIRPQRRVRTSPTPRSHVADAVPVQPADRAVEGDTPVERARARAATCAAVLDQSAGHGASSTSPSRRTRGKFNARDGRRSGTRERRAAGARSAQRRLPRPGASQPRRRGRGAGWRGRRAERDYAYVLAETALNNNSTRSTVVVYRRDRPAAAAPSSGGHDPGRRGGRDARRPPTFYNPPFLQSVTVLVAGRSRACFVDATPPARSRAALRAARSCRRMRQRLRASPSRSSPSTR